MTGFTKMTSHDQILELMTVALRMFGYDGREWRISEGWKGAGNELDQNDRLEVVGWRWNLKQSKHEPWVVASFYFEPTSNRVKFVRGS